MKFALSFAVVLLAVGLGLLLHNRKREMMSNSRKELTFSSTDGFIQYMAEQAVRDARQDGVSLDYSVDSIERAERELGKLHDQYTADPSSISARGLASAYGAYVGEVIRKTEPGTRWERDDPVAGEKTYPLIWGAGNSYPMAWCYHRIVNGPEDNVWVKYSVLKEKAHRSQ